MSICLLLSVLTMVGARAQFHSQGGTSHSASPALARGEKRPSTPRQERRSSNTIRVHKMAPNPPATKIGLLSATQIPAGPGGSACKDNSGNQYPSCASTTSPYPAVLGHFKGDGSEEVAAVVQAHHQPGTKFAISVEMPNGNGTFTPTLTVPATQPNEFDPIFVGSLENDAYDDLVTVQVPGTIQVLLNNRDHSGTFTPQTPVTVTGTLIVGGALADVNGDTKLDLVLVDGSNPGNVWTLLGNGNGTFQAASSVALPIGSQLSSTNPFNTVAFADFNNDGQLDLAGPNAASYNGKQVIVFINNGSGTSYTATPLNTPDGYYDACFNAAGDLSGHSSALDLVSANCFDDYITIYVNNGDGTFQNNNTGVYYQPVFGSPSAVSIADVNGDGKQDVVSVSLQSSAVEILLGNGDGTVGPESAGFVTGGRPQVPAVVTDLNGDGKADLVVPDNEYSFAYLQGYGDGTFRSGINYYGQIGNGLGNGVFPQGSAIASGDFNGDGIPDFVIGNTNYTTTNGQPTPNAGITVFLSNPDGSMQPGVNYSNPNVPTFNLQFVAVADFNHDGILDIAATDSVNGGVQIFTGNGTSGKGNGTFTPNGTEIKTDTASCTASVPCTLGIVAADFNGDGWADISVVNNPTATIADVGVLLNDKTGKFGSPTNYALSNVATEIAAGDLGTGKISLAVPLYGYTGNAGSAVAIFLGNGNGTFQTEADTTVGNNPYAAAIGDLNGDGKPDLAVTIDDQTTPSNQGIAIALGNGDGTFGAATLLLTTLQDPAPDNPLPAYVKIADMNDDGIPDLVYSNSEFGTVGILYGEPIGGSCTTLPCFYDPLEFPAGRWAFGIAVAGVNGTGAKDVVASGNSQDFSGVTVLLNTGDTSTSIGSSANPSDVGTSVTFTATVAAKVKGVSGPSNQGTVTFEDGGNPLGSPVPLSSGQATLQTNSLAVGSHNITAVYNGDGGNNFLPSTSSVLVQVVNQGTSSTSLSSSANPQKPGQMVTFTATVTSTVNGDKFSPTGTVTFYNGSNALGQGTLSSGKATFQTSSLPIGTNSITAVYGGDTNFTGSTSPVLNQVIGQAGTTTAVASSLNPAYPTQSVTFTATVTSTVNGLQAVPTGTVTFNDGTAKLGTGTLSSGKATFSTSSLAVGSHSITAVYGGDTNFTGSTSSVLNQKVEQVGTTASLASSANPAYPTQSVTFTATVTSTVNGLQVSPSGTVTFNDGTAKLGTGTLSSGKATFSSSSLAVGSHSITAVYGGDTNFTGSTSSAVNEVVAVPDYTLSVDHSSQTVTAGSSAKYTITLTPKTGYDGAVTFACPATLPTGVSCKFLPNPLTPTGTPPFTSVATITTTAPSAALIVPADVNAIHGNVNLLASLSAIGLMGLVLTGDWKKRKLSGRFAIMAVIALVMILAWAGCGGGGSSSTPPPPSGGTPAGTYPLQLTATGTAGTNGGSTTPQTLNITLVVQ